MPINVFWPVGILVPLYGKSTWSMGLFFIMNVILSLSSFYGSLSVSQDEWFTHKITKVGNGTRGFMVPLDYVIFTKHGTSNKATTCVETTIEI